MKSQRVAWIGGVLTAKSQARRHEVSSRVKMAEEWIVRRDFRQDWLRAHSIVRWLWSKKESRRSGRDEEGVGGYDAGDGICGH